MDLAGARDGEDVVAGAVDYVPPAFALVITFCVGWEIRQPGGFLETAFELDGFERGEGVS